MAEWLLWLIASRTSINQSIFIVNNTAVVRTLLRKYKGIALHWNTISELRDVTWYMGSHFHPTQVNAPRLIPAMHAGTRFTYPGGTEGWVDLVDLIATRPGIEPTTFRSRVRRRTAAPLRMEWDKIKPWETVDAQQQVSLQQSDNQVFSRQNDVLCSQAE